MKLTTALTAACLATSAFAEDQPILGPETFDNYANSLKACSHMELLTRDTLTRVLAGITEVKVIAEDQPKRPTDDRTVFEKALKENFSISSKRIKTYAQKMEGYIQGIPITKHGERNTALLTQAKDFHISGHHTTYPNNQAEPSINSFRGKIAPYADIYLGSDSVTTKLEFHDTTLEQSCYENGNRMTTRFSNGSAFNPGSYSLEYTGNFADAGFCKILTDKSKAEVRTILESVEIELPSACESSDLVTAD